jgi:TatA/E family protein of Tat protein translocase
MSTLALIGTIGTTEAIVILIIGLLLFGRRLPEVGRSLGKGIVEFRRGLSGIEHEIDDASRRPASPPRVENVTRPPLTEGGEDVRVSRGAAQATSAEPQTQG